MDNELTTDYCDGRTLAEAIRIFESQLALKARLMELPNPAAPTRRGDGWTKQQELGHLCDSALNNIQRFVRLQVASHSPNGEWLAQGYAQAEWVRVLGYDTMPWPETVDLWAALQGRILHLLRTVRPECLGNVWVYGQHRLTLEWLMVDYTGHHEHHMRRILGS